MIAAPLSNRERLILQLANTVAVLLVLLYLYLISSAAPFWQTAPSLPLEPNLLASESATLSSPSAVPALDNSSQ